MTQPFRFLCLWTALCVALAGAVPVVSYAADETEEEDLSSVSMEFDNAPLKDVLKILSQQSGANFAASEQVENKKVTVFLQNVPLKDAIDSIISANNLRYEQKKGSNVIIVYPAADAGAATGTVGGSAVQTRIFPIKYTRISISPLDIGGESIRKELEKSGAIQVSQTAAPTQTDQGSGDAKKDVEKLVAERGIDKVVSSLLSPNGHVTVDLNTNSLIVTDTVDQLSVIEKVISKLDVPQQQAMIEVHVLEVKKDILDDIGVDWGGTDGALFSFTGGTKTTPFPFFQQQRGGTVTFGTMSATNFKATLRFLSTHSGTKILARPRVLTMNNEAAIIKLVTDTAVARSSTLTASEGISTLTTGQASRTEVGIILKMTPQINTTDETIGLYLEPSVTTVAASTFFPSDFLDPTTRTVRTMARVRNHETLVIGGLIDSNNSLAKKKIPLLGDIPVVGQAFRYDNGDDTKRELLVFITPHIVKGYDSLADESATAYSGSEVAVQRMLNQFRSDTQSLSMDSFAAGESDKQPVFRQEHRLMRAPNNFADNGKIDKEMTMAMDAVSGEKVQGTNVAPKNIKN